MPLTEIIGLILAAAAGGAINAVAGGGTIVTFPTLLFFGMSSKTANATSTLALVIGTSASIYSYRGHWPAMKPWLTRFVPISIVGAVLGAALLYRTSERAFDKLVPFLIFFATVLFVSQGVVRRFANLEAKSGHPHAIFGAILFQFAVALYGGYFGAGIGILMLASLAFIGGQHSRDECPEKPARFIDKLCRRGLVCLRRSCEMASSRRYDDWRAGRLFSGRALFPTHFAATRPPDHHRDWFYPVSNHLLPRVHEINRVRSQAGVRLSSAFVRRGARDIARSVQ